MMTKLTYDAQGFIVGAKKSEQLGAKIADDTAQMVAILSKKGRLVRQHRTVVTADHTVAPATQDRLPSTPISPKQTQTPPKRPRLQAVNENELVNTHSTGRLLDNSTRSPIVINANNISNANHNHDNVSHDNQRALNHRIKEQLNSHARKVMPKADNPSQLRALPTKLPPNSVPNAEIVHDKHTLRLIDRLINAPRHAPKKAIGASLLGGLLSWLPFGKLGKWGKWLMRGLKRFPLIAGVIGGIELVRQWHTLSKEQKFTGVGKVLGSVGGAMGGAIIGQALIPIPVVGAIVGAIVGEKLGSFVGNGVGSGLYKIANSAFGEWLATFKPDKLSKALQSLWHDGIKPLITGAKRALDWLKERIQSVIDTFKNVYNSVADVAKGVYGEAVDNVSSYIENAVNGAKSLVERGRAFLGGGQAQNQGNYTPPKEAIKAANIAYSRARDRLLGECAKFVNNAFRDIGYRAGGHGYQVADNLYKYNKGKFEYVTFDENYVPQVGDVMSFTAGKRVGARQRKKHGTTYGHAQIYTEKGWVSDGKQKSMWAGNDYKADYADGSGKIIVVRPVGGKFTANPTQSPKPQGVGVLKQATTLGKPPTTFKGVDGGMVQSSLGQLTPMQSALTPPATPALITPAPDVSPKPKPQGGKTTVITQGNKPKDRSPMHKVV